MTDRNLFFPFTHITHSQLKIMCSLFSSFENLVLEESYENYPELKTLMGKHKVNPWFLTAQESKRTEIQVSQYLDWAKIHKGNEHNLKALFQDTPYFTNDSDVSAIKSQLKRSSEESKNTIIDDTSSSQHLLFLKMAQLCDQQNESIHNQLKDIDKDREKLFSALRGLDLEKASETQRIQPDDIQDVSAIMAKERIIAWSRIMVEKGALGKEGKLPLLITTSIAVIDFLVSSCDNVINALDLHSLKVHENDCKNIKEWQSKFRQNLMDAAKAMGNLDTSSLKITDNCDLEGQIKLYLFSGNDINKLFNRTEKQIPVCLVQLK